MVDVSASDWSSFVIDFLLPNELSREEGWDHNFSSAYQISCEALCKLGQADETKWGAVPRVNPQLPDIMPRWDDLCIAVIGLAHQEGKLNYRLADGVEPPKRRDKLIGITTHIPSPPEANISSSAGLGPAHADSEVLVVLKALGLVAKSTWTEAATVILWRKNPPEWNLDFTSDARFAEGVAKAIHAIPDDIRAELSRLVTITEEDVKAFLSQSKTHYEELRERYGSKARIGPPSDPERARQQLSSVRAHDLDWVFYRRWRLSDNWLTPQQAQSALQIFHDPLARAVRRSVVEHYFPDFPKSPI